MKLGRLVLGALIVAGCAPKPIIEVQAVDPPKRTVFVAVLPDDWPVCVETIDGNACTDLRTLRIYICNLRRADENHAVRPTPTEGRRQ